MKKSILLTTSLLLALGVTGCDNNQNLDNNSEHTSQESTIDESTTSTEKLNEVKSLLESENTLELPYLKHDSIKDVSFLTDVVDTITDGLAYQAAMNVHVQDVIIAKTSDVDAVKDAFSNYLNSDTIRLFKDGYGGEGNITSIQNAIINNVGDYAYLIAAPNATQIEKILISTLNK